MDKVKPETIRRSQRRENRMCIVQFLYQWEINKPEYFSETVSHFFENQENKREYYAFAENLLHELIVTVDTLDAEIKKRAKNWTFERIAKVDLAILRLAIYELLFRSDIPPIVTIDEAIELSKTFSNQDSKRFINGILDQMKNKINRPLREAAD